MQQRSARTIALISALVAWFAILAQLYLIIANRETSVFNTLCRFLGYFTIDTNIIVALCFTAIAKRKDSLAGNFFSKPTTITAITVYISIVGIVYNVVLRSTWNPQGLQKIVDELLHSVIPVLFIFYWLIFVPIENLKWKNAILWLIYPVLYMIYALILGAVTKWYPYPFVDVNELGYNKALINAGGVLLVIFILSLALITAGKLMKRFDSDKEKTVVR